MNSKILKYAFGALQKEYSINKGLRSNRCYNAPLEIILRITHRCNARCITCDYWKNTDTQNELSIDDWTHQLRELSRWAKPAYVTFTGGEPFVKEGFYELLELANSLSFCTSVHSNGIVFDEKQREKIFRLNPGFLWFSLNGSDSNIHDRYKGVSGLHEKVSSVIKYKKSIQTKTRIGVLSLITSDTYKSMSAFAQWAYSLGADNIDFSTIRDKIPSDSLINPASQASQSNPLWKTNDMQALERQIAILQSMKRKGIPIVTPSKDLERLKIYFRDPSLLFPRAHCSVGLRKLIVFPDGGVKLCFHFPFIGNCRDKSIEELWFSDQAQAQRQQMTHCPTACVMGGLREYTLREKLFILLTRLG